MAEAQKLVVLDHAIEAKLRADCFEEVIVRVRHRLGQVHVAAMADAKHRVASDDAFLKSGERDEGLDGRAWLEPAENAIFWLTMVRMRPVVGSTATTEPFSWPSASTAICGPPDAYGDIILARIDVLGVAPAPIDATRRRSRAHRNGRGVNGRAPRGSTRAARAPDAQPRDACSSQ